jgi:hypothetical protein
VPSGILKKELRLPTPWLKRIRKTGQLTVFNKATAWADSVGIAIMSFNNLSLGVQLVAEKEEKSANIVLILASGPQQYKYYGDIAKTSADFKADRLHGETSALIDEKRDEIFFAAVFLPGKVQKPSKGQKEVIVVHELIHASGMVSEHDSVGIMFATMKEANGGLIEYLPDKGAKPMPPIRVGSQTLCKMRMLWSGANACKDD